MPPAAYFDAATAPQPPPTIIPVPTASAMHFFSKRENEKREAT